MLCASKHSHDCRIFCDIQRTIVVNLKCLDPFYFADIQNRNTFRWTSMFQNSSAQQCSELPSRCTGKLAWFENFVSTYGVRVQGRGVYQYFFTVHCLLLLLSSLLDSTFQKYEERHIMFALSLRLQSQSASSSWTWAFRASG
jgi:hypothetical protein